MNDFRIEPLNALEEIEPLLTRYEFNEYRNYRIFTEEMLQRFLRSRILYRIENNATCMVAWSRVGEPVGFISLARLEWDTAHFGIEMALLDHLMARGTYEQRIAVHQDLLERMLQLCKEWGVEHVSCKVDTGDIACIHALEINGFRNMGTMVTHLFDKRKQRIPQAKNLCTIRLLEDQDRPAVLDIARHAFSLDRFHADPYIPKERSDALYIVWAQKVCDGAMADEVLVAERRGHVVGFLGYRYDKELEKITGVRRVGSGLGAVSPQGRGAYMALVAAALQRMVPKSDIIDVETQINNYPSLRIEHRLGFELVRSRHAFHKWLGSSSA